MEKGRGWVMLYALTVAGVLLTAKLGSHAVTVMSENAPVIRQHTVVIDAGHGGVDGGATSCTGKLESGYNLEIALRLRDLMELLGHETRMIRTTDESVYTSGDSIAEKKISDLRERVRRIRQETAPLLLSIHQNYFPDPQYSGAQVFYAGTAGSRELAEEVQRSLGKLDPSNRRGAKKSTGVYLMEQIECPGILLECGFLSNRREEALLGTPAYQKRLCCAVAAAVDRWIPDT